MMQQDLTTSSEEETLAECQQVIGYQFRKPKLLRAALTHASGADHRLASNERLEFLGDAILGLVTCEYLFQQFPSYQEGDLTKLKSAVVSRRTCARISRKMHLGDFLFLGKGMNTHTDVPASLLADVYESVVGAIYLDGGLEAGRGEGVGIPVGLAGEREDELALAVLAPEVAHGALGGDIEADPVQGLHSERRGEV